MDEIICTDDSMPFLSDDFDMERHYDQPVRELEAEGFIRAPDWMPAGVPGFEWRIVAMSVAMMRPAPRWYHKLRWWRPQWWIRVKVWWWFRRNWL